MTKHASNAAFIQIIKTNRIDIQAEAQVERKGTEDKGAEGAN